MKIMLVNSGLRFGGAETQLVALMRQFCSMGHEVMLFLLTADAPRLAELSDLAVVVVQADKRSRLDFKVLWQLRQNILRWRPDVVHGFLYDGNLYSRLAAWRTGVPAINSERNTRYRLNRAQAVAQRPTGHLATAVVANSHEGAKLAQQLFRLPADRVHVVWNGIALQAVRRRADEQRSDWRGQWFGSAEVWVAMMVGTVSEPKDHLLALRVAECLLALDPRWRVVLVGASFGDKLPYANDRAVASGRYELAVQARYQSIPEKDRILFTGQRTDALHLIASADVLFSTSVHEGFPNVVLEAMALGTPVVSTEYSDIRMILPLPWQVVDNRDPHSLAAAVARAREQSADVAGRQTAWVQANARIEVSAQRMLDVYGHYARKPRDCG